MPAVAYLANHHTLLARLMLLVVGVLLVGSGLYVGALSGRGARSAWAVLADFDPRSQP